MKGQGISYMTINATDGSIIETKSGGDLYENVVLIECRDPQKQHSSSAKVLGYRFIDSDLVIQEAEGNFGDYLKKESDGFWR